MTYKRYGGFYDKQKDIIDSQSRFTYTLSGNKTGKTMSHAIWLLEKAIMNDNCHFSWVGYTFKIAEIGFDLCCDFLSSAKIGDYCKINKSKLIIKLPNNSVIRFFGAENPDSIYGYENFAAVMDEASRCKEDSYNAIMTTVMATNGPIRFIGNPTIKNNWFYKKWSRIYKLPDHTNGKESAFKLTALDAIEAGIMAQEVFDFAKENYTTAIFERDFLALVPEGETAVFKHDKIYECIEKEDIGNSLNKAVYIGVDLGFTTGQKNDYTVVIALDKLCRVVFYKRLKASGQDLIDKLKAYIGNHIAYIDKTGGGITIYELLKADCPNLEPYNFTNATKTLCIENLAHYIHSNKLSYPDNKEILDELIGYEIDFTKTGKPTYNNGKSVDHDDIVIALGLAVLKYKEKQDLGDEYTFNIYTDEDDSYDDEVWEELGSNQHNSFQYNL